MSPQFSIDALHICGRMWRLIISLCLALFLVRCVSAQENSAAPPQQQQRTTYSAHPSLFTLGSIEEVWDDQDAPEEETSRDAARPEQEWESDEMDADQKNRIELMQYPLESAAADPAVPEIGPPSQGWNPMPYIRGQLSKIPPEHRGLRFKDTSAIMSVLPGGSNPDSMFFSTLNVRSSAYFAQLPIVQVTPRFGWHLTDGPSGADVPSQLYDTGIDTSVMLPCSDRLNVLLSVGPSMFSDGRNLSSQAFRMTGSAISFYQWKPTTKIAVGFVYLGRDDLVALPVAGLIYQPNERVKVDLFFPKPKVSYRLFADEETEHWCYIAGELGGGSWAIERTSGVDDVMTYRDYRLIAGMEQTNKGAMRWLVEAGFVFGRKIEYETTSATFNPGATGLIRAGLIF